MSNKEIGGHSFTPKDIRQRGRSEIARLIDSITPRHVTYRYLLQLIEKQFRQSDRLLKTHLLATQHNDQFLVALFAFTGFPGIPENWQPKSINIKEILPVAFAWLEIETARRKGVVVEIPILTDKISQQIQKGYVHPSDVSELKTVAFAVSTIFQAVYVKEIERDIVGGQRTPDFVIGLLEEDGTIKQMTLETTKGRKKEQYKQIEDLEAGVGELLEAHALKKTHQVILFLSGHLQAQKGEPDYINILETVENLLKQHQTMTTPAIRKDTSGKWSVCLVDKRKLIQTGMTSLEVPKWFRQKLKGQYRKSLQKRGIRVDVLGNIDTYFIDYFFWRELRTLYQKASKAQGTIISFDISEFLLNFEYLQQALYQEFFPSVEENENILNPLVAVLVWQSYINHALDNIIKVGLFLNDQPSAQNTAVPTQLRDIAQKTTELLADNLIPSLGYVLAEEFRELLDTGNEPERIEEIVDSFRTSLENGEFDIRMIGQLVD